MRGEVISIFIASSAGKSMEQISRVEIVAGEGIQGDRYAKQIGSFSRSKRKTIRHITLIAEEAIKSANAELAEPFLPEETRRNILTLGIDLNALVGMDFFVGAICMRGVELCDPCGRPSSLAGKQGFQEAFQNRGGLRAEVLTSGIIHIGDIIALTR